MDGNDTVPAEIEDDYSETEHYWKTGKLGTIYQTYLDVNEIINLSYQKNLKMMKRPKH